MGVVVLLLYMTTMAYPWRGLGDWKLLVLIYGLVLPFLLSRAISAFFGSDIAYAQSSLLSIGTGMLYLGDLEYGVHRFRKPLRFMFGPMLYAGGQMPIALGAAFT